MSYLTSLLDCTYSKGSDWKKPTCVASKKNRFSGVFQPSVFGGSHLLTSRSFPRFGVISNLTLFDSANRVKPPPRGDVSMHPNRHILMVPNRSPVTAEEILNPGWSRNQWLRTIGSTMHGPSSPFGNAGKCLGG